MTQVVFHSARVVVYGPPEHTASDLKAGRHMVASMGARTVGQLQNWKLKLSETLMMQPDPFACKGFLKTVMK